MKDQRMKDSTLKNEIRDDEKVLWQGKPNPDKHFVLIDFYLIPFSLLWSGLVFYFFIKQLLLPGFSFFSIFLLPFLAAGVFFTVGRFVLKRYRKLRTTYILTDKRAIEIYQGKQTITKDIDYDSIAGSVVSSNSNRIGRIIFEKTFLITKFKYLYSNTGMESVRGFKIPAFYDIDNVDRPKRVLEEQLRIFSSRNTKFHKAL